MIVPSAPVIPYDDPTLLFTNAGMNQFKDVFLGTGKRDYTRVADSQKCIRVSGKHNDLEEVGKDTYHHTFFEMLGNWSFGDYYKKEAIIWGWELLTEVWKLPKNRLWATVYKTDDEADECWKRYTDINPSHVLRFGEKDNFWEMGETGPCGPCSEIHIELSEKGDIGASLINAGSPDAIEIWNLVFIQYNRSEKGELEPLPAKHVDTGMGFERVVALLQGKKSNYDTDLFAPIIDQVCALADWEYRGTPGDDFSDPRAETDVAIRVIADHSRMLTFSIADGEIPSNVGRGYVLRKIVRRAAIFGRHLNMHEPFIYKVVEGVVRSMGKHYPAIKDKQSYIEKIIKSEEEAFSITQDKGIDLFYRNIIGERIRRWYIEQNRIEDSWWVDTRAAPLMLILRDPTVSRAIEVPLTRDINQRLHIKLDISAEDAFRLHDTYGIPLDFTKMLGEELGLEVDVAGFNELMEKQRERSRTWNIAVEAGSYGITGHDAGFEVIRGKNSAKRLQTEAAEKIFQFVGYDFLETAAVVLKVQDNLLVLDKTAFYAESGGQVGDEGVIESNGRRLIVIDTQKSGGVNVHVLESPIELPQKAKVLARVDAARRYQIMKNHTATHIVHEALRQVLGTHLHQQGSLVAPDRLRFDFNHVQKVSPEEIKDEIDVIALNDPKDWITIDEAKRRYPNVKMFFGDKYGDRVRIVEIDPKFSVELCGGTHVKNTRDIGLFKIISESSIASGIRRIEAVTGKGIDDYIEKQLVRRAGELDDELARLIEEKETLEKELNVQPETKTEHETKRPSVGQIESAKPTLESIRSMESSMRNRENAVSQLIDQTKSLKKALSRKKVREEVSNIDDLLLDAVSLDGFKVVSAKVDASTMDELKSIADSLRAKIGSGVGVLGAVVQDKVALVCVVTDDIIKEKHIEAGKIVGEVAKHVGGGGGGRPHLATAGGKDVQKLDEALKSTQGIVRSFLS
jgi:alanyl-tRNA synthetase